MELGFSILAALILLGTMITGLLGFKDVPEGFHYLVERLGKFTHILEPGPRLIYPFVEFVTHKVDMREQNLSLTPSIQLENSIEISLQCDLWFQVEDAAQASYAVSDYQQSLVQILDNYLHSHISSKEKSVIFAEQTRIADQVQQDLAQKAESWGIAVRQLQLSHIKVC